MNAVGCVSACVCVCVCATRAGPRGWEKERKRRTARRILPNWGLISVMLTV